MKRGLLAVIFFLAVHIGYSQQDFREGFIVTHQKDTVRGVVDYRVGTKNFDECNFIKSGSETMDLYKPGDILGYGFVDDKFFESREMVADDRTIKPVYIEVIVRGLVSLYRHKGNLYIEKDNGGMLKLTNETKDVLVNGVKIRKSTNQHIVTVSTLLFDCSELRPRLQEFALSEKPLASLVEDYNKCKNSPSTTFKSKKPWAKSFIGLQVGMNFSQVDYQTNVPFAQNLKAQSNSPVVGISWDLSLPRLNERMSFHADIFYLKTRYNLFALSQDYGVNRRNYVTLDMPQVKIPVGFRYTFPERTVTPFLNAGGSYTIHTSSSATWVREVEYSGIVETYKLPPPGTKSTEVGFWFGAGLIKSVHKKFSAFIEIRYEQTDGIGSSFYDPTQSSKISNFQIMLGVRTK